MSSPPSPPVRDDVSTIVRRFGNGVAPKSTPGELTSGTAAGARHAAPRLARVDTQMSKSPAVRGPGRSVLIQIVSPSALTSGVSSVDLLLRSVAGTGAFQESAIVARVVIQISVPEALGRSDLKYISRRSAVRVTSRSL